MQLLELPKIFRKISIKGPYSKKNVIYNVTATKQTAKVKMLQFIKS